MGLFKKIKKKTETTVSLVPSDFPQIDSIEKAVGLARQGNLHPLYCMPLRFNGEESGVNTLYVPKGVVDLKDRYDDVVESLLLEDRMNGYSCTPKYKGSSVVPSEITIEAKKDSVTVFKETIHIW